MNEEEAQALVDQLEFFAEAAEVMGEGEGVATLGKPWLAKLATILRMAAGCVTELGELGQD